MNRTIVTLIAAFLTWGPDQRLTRNEACSWASSMVAREDELFFAWFDQQDAEVTCADAERDLDAAMRLVGLTVEPYGTGVYQQTRPHTAHQRAEAKHRQMEAALPKWAMTGDVERLKGMMRELQAMMDPPAPAEMKERKIDEIMALMGLTYDPDAKVTVYFESAMYARIQEKMQRIQAAAPEWVARGGDAQRLEGMLKAFKERMEQAVRAWEVYFQRSDDRGRTWTKPVRLTSAPGLSQRPSLGVDGDVVHVAWFDGRDGEVGVYYKRSRDGGRTWSADRRLSLPGVEAQHASLAVGAGAVHVVWHQSTGEIRYLRLPGGR